MELRCMVNSLDAKIESIPMISTPRNDFPVMLAYSRDTHSYIAISMSLIALALYLSGRYRNHRK